MSIDPGTSRPRRSGWAVFYSDPAITVTTRYVQTTHARYEVAELHDVVRVLGYSYPGVRVALATGVVELVLAAALTIAARSWLMACAGVVAVVGMMVGVLVDTRRNPRWMQLWATYRGREVLIFCSPDRTEFGRVQRAMIRAVEGSRQPLP
jgi:hypothetical protein